MHLVWKRFRQWFFSNILEMGMTQLPRRLCYWLMSRVDTEGLLLVGVDGREHRLEASQVRDVMGIPMDIYEVPKMIVEEDHNMVTEVEHISGIYYEEGQGLSIRITSQLWKGWMLDVSRRIREIFGWHS